MNTIQDKVSNFHLNARNGHYAECAECKRNPKTALTSYAETCPEHFGISKNGLLIMMSYPGGSTGGATKTNRLCPYCNRDKSAVQFSKLLNLIIIPSSNIYFSNSVLHGFSGINKVPGINEKECCKKVIARLFNILSPKIVFTLGKEAFESSFAILSNNNVKASMNLWIKNEFYFGSYNSTHLFSMPNISFCGPNLSKYGLNVNDVFIKISNDINRTYKNN